MVRRPPGPGQATGGATDESGGDVHRSLRRDLREAERRFLALQSRAADGPTHETLTEFLAILGGLRTIGNRLVEMVGRRDVSYFTDRRLAILNQQCLWLARRVSAEFLLLHQIRLEQALKRLFGPQAYQMYLRLEDIEDTAREVDALDDRDLLARLSEGTLAREILEQALGSEEQIWLFPNGREEDPPASGEDS
ncbi:MAG: hypothetical protein QN131_05370 [Armatimonadota bacterium]|nr:hypothetical protein [Armatimonadota bacterium]MDR7549357.1 hypothetical protein [Armatimonadota bacterium]